MSPAEYANEIMTKGTSSKPSVLKSKVEEALDNEGAYVVFTTQELNTKHKDARIVAVRNQLKAQGKSYSDTCTIKIYDAAQIAAWVNKYIPTIVAVQHWLCTPVERGLKTYALWSEYEDLSKPYVETGSRQDIINSICEKIVESKSCSRLIGLSGLRKTRTAYQIFKDNEELRSLLIYVDANHAPSIDALVADWAGLGIRAVVIVDNCDYRLHESLVKEVGREKSQLSLLSLDYDIDSVSSSSNFYRLEPMSNTELTELLSPIYRESLADLDRVVAFAQGFPQMAVLLAKAIL